MGKLLFSDKPVSRPPPIGRGQCSASDAIPFDCARSWVADDDRRCDVPITLCL